MNVYVEVTEQAPAARSGAAAGMTRSGPWRIAAAGVLLAPILAAAPVARAQQPAEPPVTEDLEMLPGQVARLQTLDKISARISTIEVPVGGTVSWERLDISVAKCARSSPFERPERAALVKVTERRRGLAPVEVFSGWMFASSPALHAVEHPVYDVLVIDCMTWAAAGSGPAGDGSGSAAAPAGSSRP